MKYRTRIIEKKVIELFGHFPVVAVLGVRQVGKTTLVEHLPIPGLKSVVFDPVQDVMGARSDPDLFLQNQPRPLFLDEIQFAPELLPAIKREVDRKRKAGLFIISGSQNLMVHKQVAESLAGRVAIVHLLPMSWCELSAVSPVPGLLERLVFEGPEFFRRKQPPSGQPPGIFRAMWRGGMPGTLDLPDHLLHDFFSSYFQSYVERDVRTSAAVSSLQQFGRLFGLLAALTSGQTNHNKLGRELGIDRKTAKAWVEIAISTFQWFELPAYSRNPVKRVASKPKGYISDTGMACYLQRLGSADALAASPLAGAMFETYVVLEIMKRSAAWPVRPGMFHFRTHVGAEIDLVLELNGVLHPVEAKLTTNPRRRDCRAFDSFRAVFPEARVGLGFVVCCCEQPFFLRPDTVA
ncbi:MAG: ATP-binding protein, partial [Deltaproteobacteria bacterium]